MNANIRGVRMVRASHNLYRANGPAVPSLYPPTRVIISKQSRPEWPGLILKRHQLLGQHTFEPGWFSGDAMHSVNHQKIMEGIKNIIRNLASNRFFDYLNFLFSRVLGVWSPNERLCKYLYYKAGTRGGFRCQEVETTHR